MGRIFEDNLHDLPRIGVPAWELCERLEKLVTEGELPMRNPVIDALAASIRWTARDERGEYDKETLADFRREVEKQERPPHTVQFRWLASGGFVNAYASTRIGSGGQVQSEYEAFVHHVAKRIRDLYAQAAERLPPAREGTFEEASERAAVEYALEEAEKPRYVNVVTGVSPPRPKPSLWQKHGERTEKWALVIVPVVVGVLLTAWVIGK